MKRTLSILVVVLLAASVVSTAHVMAQAPSPMPQQPGGAAAPSEAKQIEGKVKSFNGGVVTLEDGTKLMIPASVRVQRDALKEGATVKASFTENAAGQKIVTAIQVQ